MKSFVKEKHIEEWDGRGAAVDQLWDGKYFTSYKSSCNYVSRYVEKGEKSIDLPDPIDHTGVSSGEERK